VEENTYIGVWLGLVGHVYCERSQNEEKGWFEIGGGVSLPAAVAK